MTQIARTSANNPFRPGFGAVPDVWVGRDEALADYERQRLARLLGQYTRGTVFVGPSGIGKSVLVNRLAEQSQVHGDVVLKPVRIAKRTDPISQLAAAVNEAREQVAGDRFLDGLERLLSKLEIISIKGIKLAKQQEQISNPHLVVRDTLIALGELLARENTDRAPDRRRVLVIRIDELQNADDSQRSALLAALGDVLEHQVPIDTRDGTGAKVRNYLPILLYLSGLPELLNRTTNVDTFRRRFATTPLRWLQDAEIIKTLQSRPINGVSFNPDAAVTLANVVAGDPYLFQVLGQHAWNASDAPQITLADVEQANRETYGDRLRVVEAAASDIPEAEMELLKAVYETVNQLFEVQGSQVARYLGKTPAEIATSAARLERRAAITRELGRWRVENQLLHRFITTGDVV